MQENEIFDQNQIGATVTSDSLNISSHAVHGLFYLELDLGRADLVEKTLEARADEALAMPSSAVQEVLQLVKPHPDLRNTLWESSDGKGLALGDFYPHVRQILGEKHDESAAPEGSLICKSLKMTDETCRVLSQLHGGKPRNWRTQLGKAASKRCGQESIDVQFDRARLYLFRTGIVILDLTWHYHGESLPASVVLEGNYLFSHGQYKTEVQTAQGGDKPIIDADGLRVIAQALLPKQWGESTQLMAGRLQLYTLAKVEDAASEENLRQLAIWLSHRQTKDYTPSESLVGDDALLTFPYLCHAVALEGAASVIANSPMASDFVKTFVLGTGANTYVPLYVTNLHNHLWLLSQAKWLPSRRHGGERHEARSLESLYERMVEFRRYFYHPLVSQITLHNVFFQRCQDKFKINERQQLLEQTASDNAEIVKARNSLWFKHISSALAVLLAIPQLLDIFSKLF